MATVPLTTWLAIALMRLRRHQDAVTVYGHALRDPIYDRRGAVWANLGAAYVEIGDYAEAARAYEEAIWKSLTMQRRTKRFKVWPVRYWSEGRVEEAAVAYRKAALDPGNPDPGKPLVNLGLCFMALGRAEDAIEAYHAALGFDQYKGRGKALANLGQAHVALGQYAEAVKSFEKSTQMHSHKLSPAASAAYATALQQLHPEDGEAGAQSSAEQSTKPVIADDAAIAEFFGEEPGAVTVPVPATIPEVGLDEAAAAVGVATAVSPLADVAAPAPANVSEQLTQPLVPFDQVVRESDLRIGDEKAVADFFSVSEEELKARGREASRAERHAKGPHAIWRTVAVVAVAVVIVLAGLIGAYEMGYGWPTQDQSVAGMMSAYQAGTSADAFWVAARPRTSRRRWPRCRQ